MNQVTVLKKIPRIQQFFRSFLLYTASGATSKVWFELLIMCYWERKQLEEMEEHVEGRIQYEKLGKGVEAKEKMVIRPYQFIYKYGSSTFRKQDL